MSSCAVTMLWNNWNKCNHCHYCLTEKQFAQLIGRCRLYQHLSPVEKLQITPLTFGDQQLNSICKDYYRTNLFAVVKMAPSMYGSYITCALLQIKAPTLIPSWKKLLPLKASCSTLRMLWMAKLQAGSCNNKFVRPSFLIKIWKDG